MDCIEMQPNFKQCLQTLSYAHIIHVVSSSTISIICSQTSASIIQQKMKPFCIFCVSSLSPTATPPTFPSWSTTRGLALPSPPAPAWSCARAASDWAPREATSCANAITSFAPSPPNSRVAPVGRRLPASRGGLSARRASARWSGSAAWSRPPREA